MSFIITNEDRRNRMVLFFPLRTYAPRDLYLLFCTY